jgi:hypothetical protein
MTHSTTCGCFKFTGKTSPQATCQQLGECKNNVIDAVATIGDDKLCGECEKAVAKVITNISLTAASEKKIDDEIITLVCKNKKPACSFGVKAAMTEVFKDIKKAQANATGSAKGVCTKIDICPTTHVDTCKLCQKALGFVGKEAKDFNGSKIEADWKEGCNAFPKGSPDRTKCIADIDAFFPDLVKFLDTLGADTEQVCTTAGFCPAFDPKWIEQEICHACTDGFNTLIEVVKDTKVTEKEAEADVTKLCNELNPTAPKVASACLAFVKKDFKTIWDAMDGTTSAAETCKSLKACGPSPSPPSPPGPMCFAKGVCLPAHYHRRDCCDGENTAKKDKHCDGKWKCE